MKFQRKYDMTREENIFLAKRNIVDYIWTVSYTHLTLPTNREV